MMPNMKFQSREDGFIFAAAATATVNVEPPLLMPSMGYLVCLVQNILR